MLAIALYVLAVLLILGGLVGAVLPALPGLPMLFGGIWLAAAVDDYRHLGVGWIVFFAILTAFGIAVDFVAATLGAKRMGASRRAIWGASLGTLIGMFFGIPGLLLGPFIGAVLGELASSRSVLRSAHVGVSTWLGLLLGTVVKLGISLMLIAVGSGVWLFHL